MKRILSYAAAVLVGAAGAWIAASHTNRCPGRTEPSPKGITITFPNGSGAREIHRLTIIGRADRGGPPDIEGVTDADWMIVFPARDTDHPESVTYFARPDPK